MNTVPIEKIQTLNKLIVAGNSIAWHRFKTLTIKALYADCLEVTRSHVLSQRLMRLIYSSFYKNRAALACNGNSLHLLREVKAICVFEFKSNPANRNLLMEAELRAAKYTCRPYIMAAFTHTQLEEMAGVCMLALPQPVRTVYQLCKNAYMSDKDIAAYLELPEWDVKERLAVAMDYIDGEMNTAYLMRMNNR